MTTVVALGGNALVRSGQRGTAAEQRANLRRHCDALRPLLRESLVVTHGNGPQVGAGLLRAERAAEEVPVLPLWLVVAQTQAEIGSLIALELERVAARPVACVLTRVCVEQGDPAFDRPTKPIGPFYPRDVAERLRRERDWELVEDAGRGWRRVVASPHPLEIVEADAIQVLLASGAIVVACGGGGIPVARRGEGYDGVDAVIDKDLASALLAQRLGARRLVVLTDVDALYAGFGTPAQREIRSLASGQADALLPELAAGSMRPKLEAAAGVARAGGEALITSATALEAALKGEAGTRIAG